MSRFKYSNTYREYVYCVGSKFKPKRSTQREITRSPAAVCIAVVKCENSSESERLLDVFMCAQQEMPRLEMDEH